MAIEGLNDLVNNFETSSNTYNDDANKVLEDLNNYVEDKSVENFLDNYIEKYPFFEGDISSMNSDDKEYLSRKLAIDEHEKEINSGKTINKKDEDGNVIETRAANEVNEFEKDLAEVKKTAEDKKKKLINNKIDAVKNIQSYQAGKIFDAESQLNEIKEELEIRKTKDEELSDELKSIEDGNSKFDEQIEEEKKKVLEINAKISKNKAIIDQIKANDPDGYKKNEEYLRLMDENKELRKDKKESNDKIKKYTEDKDIRKSEIEKEKADLKLDEYTNEFNTLNEKLKDQKDKYKENSEKFEEKFKEMGVDLDLNSRDEINENEIAQKEENEGAVKEKNTKEKVNNATNAVNQVGYITKQEEQNSLVQTPVGRQAALNKIAQYVENTDPTQRLDRLNNTNDYENLMNSMNDIGMTDYLQRKELKNALDENSKILNNSIQEYSYYIDMLERTLGTKLTNSQKNLCKSMFNQDKDKKGKVNNILSGTNKFSKEDLGEMKNIINQVNGPDLSSDQRQEFENNFMRYVQMGSLNSQVNKNFMSRLWYNKMPTKGARAERQLEGSIINYSNSRDKQQDEQSKGSFFNYLQDNKEADTRNVELSSEYRSSRNNKTVEQTR